MGDKISNEELVRKAVVTTDALAAAGKLNAAQADRFIDYVVDESILKNNARVERFRNETLDIDKIGLGRRAAVPKAEAVDPGIRRGVETSKISLEPRAVMVPFEISDEFTEVSIEEGVEDHIIKMMARQFSNDLEELYINADTLGHAIIENDYKAGGSTTDYIKDAYLALLTAGWLRLADNANIYDAAGANVGLSVFGNMLRQMPTKFRRNKRDLRFFMSSDLAQLYIEKIATRATALGDQAAGGAAHTPFGVQIVEVPLLSFLPRTVQHITLAASATVSLRYAPIASVVVSTETLGSTPETAFVEDTDYSVDYSAGTITNLDVGIGDGDVVKVTYDANPQILLTHMKNFIVGIGRDIRIEKDRDIFKGVNQYAITAKVAVQLEETDAVVKGQNIGTGV